MDLKHKTRHVTATIILIFLGACGKKELNIRDPLEHNLVLSGDNRPELETVLAHYRKDPSDSLKLKAALFLISHMQNKIHFGGHWLGRFDGIFDHTAGLKDAGISRIRDSLEVTLGPRDFAIRNDLQYIKAGYLIQNIDQAFESWQGAPWKSQVSFDAFCEYILPYKTLNDYPETWRKGLQEKYRYITEHPEYSQRMKSVCSVYVFEEKKWFSYTEKFMDYPSTISLGNILKGKQGDCKEMASLAAYTGRALGVPVAIDFTPQWGNLSTGHMWNALILNDSIFFPFMGAERDPGNYGVITMGDSKLAKAYRVLYRMDSTSFGARAEKMGIKEIPQNLKNKYRRDVTASYVPVSPVSLSIDAEEGTPVYLCLFKRGEWEPVEGGFVENQTVKFGDMGRNILYAPMFYKAGRYKPAAPLFIIEQNENRKDLAADNKNTEPATLSRKYPFKKQTARFTMFNCLIGARLEASQTSGFTDITVLDTLVVPKNTYAQQYENGFHVKDRLDYDSLWEQSVVHTSKAFRYIRLFNDRGKPLKIGEMEVYAVGQKEPLKGKPIGNIPDASLAFDGLPGYSIIQNKSETEDLWVGLDLGAAFQIEKIRYLPASDLNKVEPGKNYELFYWNGKWVSLGRLQSTKHFLEYGHLPKGGLFWLRCEDCNGKDERPFTYENGKQVWW